MLPYRGQCQYKGGRCPNERTLKRTGEPHTLCEVHRVRHNKIQCKSDAKMRQLKRVMAQRKQNAHRHVSRLLLPTVVPAPATFTTPVEPVDLLSDEIVVFMGMMGMHFSKGANEEHVDVPSVDLVELL
ncbi:hypothetical protein H257_06993 [Aphanomyces astaci]|uniref:Uncharacterized protein n=1 Tax=Aphanomyces astaci TaxID=112090 RepID=W4GLI1_APHAT|nr:hypothetical protein H257_06993 [Aphanomyces astaci]ETV79763.1 hypothetical protein H257_06993 [Aphanomyces astaci]|eukprot:XP_009830699.1 hypothetical protein H257_06993 [Aphanomyces astaci]